MNSDQKFEAAVRTLMQSDRRYRLEAYHFVRHGVSLECRKVGDLHPEGNPHISGRQLAEAMRELAIKQFGALALDVLAEWGIHRTEDFGAIVFNLVNANLLGASENDSIDDFAAVYDFCDAFLHPFACPAPPAEGLPPIA